MAGYEFFKTRDISRLARKCNDEGKNECNVYQLRTNLSSSLFKKFCYLSYFLTFSTKQ